LRYSPGVHRFEVKQLFDIVPDLGPAMRRGGEEMMRSSGLRNWQISYARRVKRMAKNTRACLSFGGPQSLLRTATFRLAVDRSSESIAA